MPLTFAAVHESGNGPTPTASAVRQVVGYWRYSCRDGNPVAKTAVDPNRPCGGYWITASAVTNGVPAKTKRWGSVVSDALRSAEFWSGAQGG